MYQLKFISDITLDVEEYVIIIIERTNKPLMKFSAKVVEKYGNQFIIEEKRLNLELIEDINQGTNIIYKITQNGSSYLIDYNQIFILSLVAIKNLCYRIKDLELK
jgi:hypothetical protein